MSIAHRPKWCPRTPARKFTEAPDTWAPGSVRRGVWSRLPPARREPGGCCPGAQSQSREGQNRARGVQPPGLWVEARGWGGPGPAGPKLSRHSCIRPEGPTLKPGQCGILAQSFELIPKLRAAEQTTSAGC